MDAKVVAIKQEQDAFRDIKEALDRIADAEDDILNDWVIVGDRLLGLRHKFPTWDGTFKAECRMHNIVLTNNERSAAMWWADLTLEQRDTMRKDFPDRVTPGALQDGCREKHPDWAKRSKSNASRRTGSQKTRSKQSKMPFLSEDPATPDDVNVVRLSKAEKKKIKEKAEQEELDYQRQLIQQRRHRKQEAEAQRAAEDRRPRLTPQPFEIMMFGVRMWPDPDRLKLGDYDYDQLCYAIKQFWAFWNFVPENISHESRAIYFRVCIGPLWKYVERRLTPGGPDQTEMFKFVQVFQRLADLYLENPSGENKLPHHPEFDRP